MSPVFIANPNKMCPLSDSSSILPVSLNNTQIRTLINIYQPTPAAIPAPLSQNFTMNPIDLRKHASLTVSNQALYHFYFPHLLSFQNQHQIQRIIDHEMKRSNTLDSKFNTIYFRVHSDIFSS